MDTSTKFLIGGIITLLILGTIFGIMYFIYKINNITLNKKEKIKMKELELEKLKVFITIDTKLVNEEIDKFIKKYIDRYMIKNIIINDIDYIKKDQIDSMVKDITKLAIIEMSDLYLNYCTLLTNISNDDDLLNFIYYKTTDLVLNVVTEFNKPQ